MADGGLRLNFAEHGAERLPGAAARCLRVLIQALADLPPDRPGIRLHGVTELRPYLASSSAIGELAKAVLGSKSRPVRAVLFDKVVANNWSLAWHQDRTICVKRKIDLDGYGPWTLKEGMRHVTPPFDLLSRMITLRVHLDDVPAGNAPLLIAPRSHLAGRVPEARIGEVVARCGTIACLASAGDVWLYATPILHASKPARVPLRRRVLQIDFAAEDLPGGLEWLGI